VLGGTINNTGTIALNSGGNNTFLTVNGSNLTLRGGGQVTLTDFAPNFINGTSSANKLTNIDNTISGAGQLGNGQLTFENQASGVVNATGPNALFLNTGGAAIVNAGLLEASGNGGLIIQSNLSNLAGTTLTGGADAAFNGSHIQLLNNLSIATLNANVTQSGAGSAIQSFHMGLNARQSLDSTIVSVGLAGALHITGGRNFPSTHNLSDSGIREIGGGSFQALSLSVTASGTLTGFGTINQAVINNGTIEASGGTMKFGGDLTGSGFAKIGANATLELAGNAQVVTLDSLAKLKLDSLSSFTGSLGELSPGDIIEVVNRTVTSATATGSTMAIDTTAGHLSYQLADPLLGDIFKVVDAGGGTTDLIVTLTFAFDFVSATPT
jgi:hypothetical protein